MRDTPIFSLQTTAGILKLRGGNNVVELGSIRQCPIEPLDGGSTLIWAEARFYVWSVDIDANASRITSELCDPYRRVKVINSNAHEFLNTFNESIDLLYLDAWDTHVSYCAEHHLQAFQEAECNFTSKTMVLIDDTDVEASKGRLVIPYAKQRGFLQLWTGRQTLLVQA